MIWPRKKYKSFWQEHSYFGYLLIFIIAFIVFFYLQSAPGFADPDSFYHAKMAVLIKENSGAVRQFPWLPFTILKNNYTNHHFLYHLFLVPFVTFLPPLIGTKLAAIIFSSLAILTIYWFLRVLKIRGAIFYALFLLIIQPFIFRLSLAKTQPLSLIFLLLALYFLHQRKGWQLFLLSFFYVWLYGGWPLMIVLTIVFLLVEAILQASRRYQHYQFIKLFRRNNWFKDRVKQFFNWSRARLLLLVLAGLALGLFVNPFFPKNLKFYWYQIIEIALVNYQKIIGVGAEWYPYYFKNLVQDIYLVLPLVVIALVLLIFSFKQQSRFSWSFLIFSGLFLVLTLKSRRNIEYLGPSLVIFSALAINDFIRANSKSFKEFFRFWQKHFVILKLAGIFLFIGFWFLAGQSELISVKQALSDGYKNTYLKKASYYIYKNSEPGDIIFHDDWDEFPALFYHNSKDYYIMGLDPTFMYEQNQARYWQYVDVTLGKRADEIYDIIKNKFRAKFVLATPDHQKLISNLSANFYFERVYQDEEAVVFRVL
jgi:hypothetical protein